MQSLIAFNLKSSATRSARPTPPWLPDATPPGHLAGVRWSATCRGGFDDNQLEGTPTRLTPINLIDTGQDLLKRITIDPAVRFGKPCVRGTPLTVGDVLGTLAAGSTEAELLEDFPQLSHEEVLAPTGLCGRA